MPVGHQVGIILLRTLAFVLILGLIRLAYIKARTSKTLQQDNSGNEIYDLPRIYSALGIVSGVIAFGLLSASGIFIYNYLNNKMIIFSAFFLLPGIGFGYVAVHLIGLWNYKIIIKPTGITEIMNGKITHLEWQEITRLEGLRYRQRLCIYGKNGSIISAEYQLRNVDKLFATILNNKRFVVKENELPKKFGKRHHKRQFWIILICSYIGASLLFLLSWKHGVFCIAFISIIGLLDWNKKKEQISNIEIDMHVTKIESLIKVESIKNTSIISAEIETVLDPNNNTRVVTVIKTANKTFSIHAAVANPVELVSLLKAIKRQEPKNA
jgi:hypothetical protein